MSAEERRRRRRRVIVVDHRVIILSLRRLVGKERIKITHHTHTHYLIYYTYTKTHILPANRFKREKTNNYLIHTLTKKEKKEIIIIISSIMCKN